MRRPTTGQMMRAGRGGFTLVEILIVVVILGILAAIVVPQFTNASQESRQSSMDMTIFRVQTQLEIYTNHHEGAYPSNDPDEFVAQMTRASNAAGETAAPGTPGYPFGPYLLDIPANPFTGGRQIGNGEPGSSDWYYADGEFFGNDRPERRP